MTDLRTLRLAVVVAAAASLLACGSKTPPPPPPVPVTVAAAEVRTVPFVLQANGTVEPMQTVAIQPQVGGIITRILFREGDDVKAGQPLFEIDPRSYQATYEQAQAVVARDRAQLANAQQDVTRYQTLVAKDYVTTQQFEQVKTTAAALQATLASDQAAAQQARLNLQYATIRSPISGRAGSLQVRAGNLAKVGSLTPLVTINQIHPILVRFAVPAASLTRIRQYASSTLPVSAHPTSAPGAASTGTLSFVDNAVDTTTGTILLKGMFENHDGALWPGEYVTASLQLFLQKNAVVVPSQAVVEGQQGNFVFVVNADTTATQRQVTIDRVAGDLTIVTQGIKPGDRVVTDGQLRLKSGTKVQVKPAIVDDQPRAG
jgi:membrane fusion protein, multidrug efflux system